MILLVMIPMFLLFSVYYTYISGELTQNKKEEMDKILDMEQEYLISFFDTRILEASYLSQRAEVREFLLEYQKKPDKKDAEILKGHETLNSEFAWINEQSTEIQDVFVLGPDGILIASGNPKSYWIDLSEREYFQNAMKGEIVISNLLRDKLDGKSVIFIAAPVYDSGRQNVIGVLVNLIDMKTTSEGVTNITDPKTGDAYLVDVDGDIVFHKDATKIGGRPDNKLVDDYMKSSEFQKSSGSKVIKAGLDESYITYQTVGSTGWKIVLEQDMNIIMASAYRALAVMAIVFMITGVVAFVISLKLARSITLPLTELTKIVKRTKEGDLFSRVSYTSKNEYGQLAQNFNTMLDELHATEEELRINNEDLEENRNRLEEAQCKYNVALQSAKDVVWDWDLQTGELYASDHWNTLFGELAYDPVVKNIVFEQILDQECSELFKEQVEELIHKSREWIVFTFPYENIPENKIWCQIKASRVVDQDGKVVKITGTLSDTTVQKEAEDKIWNLAFVDQLTNLPNRTSFKYKLEKRIQEAEDMDENLSVFLLDMDNLKRINDTLGHDVGDLLIIEVAKRLKEVEPEVFCLSGDEFAIICSGQLSNASVEERTRQIHELFMKPFYYQDRTIIISISIGVSIYPEDGKTWGKLAQNADTALSIAKQEGKAKTVIFNKVMSEKAMKKLEVETIVRRAIKDGLVCMYYQPQYCPVHSELKAFEALMRIQTEDGTMISPGEFIPVAEETGVIIELGTWAIREVFERIHAWSETGFLFEYVSVNVSGIQLRQTDFAEMVQKIALETGIAPKSVEIEITESTFMDTSDHNMEILSKLKHSGFRIALDDFGTGYSSFQYLRTLPITTLKIDKSFIDSIDHSKKAESIVRQIIEIGHEMDLKVVAEGVEKEEQKEILQSLSCDLIQGYYYSRPLSQEQAENVLMG